MNNKIRFRYTATLEMEVDRANYPEGVDPLGYEQEHARETLSFHLDDGGVDVSVEVLLHPEDVTPRPIKTVRIRPCLSSEIK
jgi:hypothetical protein